MFPLSHWSLRYAMDRANDAIYRWRHPDAPWLTPAANDFLASWLRPEHIGFEWGAGRSTLWLARRCARVFSVEHDPKWHERVKRSLDAEGVTRVELTLCAADSPEYARAIRAREKDSLDFVLVDGVSELRDACVEEALPRIRAGGLLILDDAHRYLPGRTRAPYPGPDPPTGPWLELQRRLAAWECVRTTDGLRDTALFIRA